jgi:hypothetical protein
MLTVSFTIEIIKKKKLLLWVFFFFNWKGPAWPRSSMKPLLNATKTQLRTFSWRTKSFETGLCKRSWNLIECYALLFLESYLRPKDMKYVTYFYLMFCMENVLLLWRKNRDWEKLGSYLDQRDMRYWKTGEISITRNTYLFSSCNLIEILIQARSDGACM